MSMSDFEVRAERYRNSREHDELGYRIRGLTHDLRRDLEDIREATVTYEELEDLRAELLERQNRMFRVLARELRILQRGK